MKAAHLLTIFVLALCIQLPVHAQNPFTVTQKEHVDLNGDGKKEVIELLARKNQYNHADAWKLIVNGKEAAAFNNKDGLYQLANMKFDDLLRDGTQNILVYFQSIGSGGITGLTVFEQAEEKFNDIFTDPNPADYFQKSKERFSMKYLGDYQVEFIDKGIGLTAVIPLSKKRYSNYPDQQELQNRLKEITTWIDPVSGYRFNEVTKNKPKEIVTIQSVSGLYHADVIAYYETTYAFSNKHQKYVPTKSALYSTEPKKQLAEKKYKQ